MRKFRSAFQTGPLLPGIRTLVVGAVTASAAGWFILSADGRSPSAAETPAITAPPTVAAHVAAPEGVQEALANTLERQVVLLESLRGRLETRTRELALVRAEIQTVNAQIARAPHVPARKPNPGDPVPTTDRMAALESEQARLEAERGEINRRIASAESFIAEARNLISFAGPGSEPGS